MSKLLSVYDRQRYPVFENAADYFEKTGLHAPWNPLEPQRHWVVKPGDKGPFLLLPDVKSADQGRVEPVELNVSAIELMVPNIPAHPSVVSWSQPSHSVTQNGQPVAQSVFFPTLEELQPVLEEVNRLARILGRPTLSDIKDGNFEGPFPFDYHNDPNLPEAKQRKRYVFSDTTGHIYDAGGWLKQRYSKGKAIREAGVVSGKVQDIEKPIGSWGYTDAGGWQFIVDRRIGLPEPIASKRPPMGICIELRADEELYVNHISLGVPVLFVKSGSGPIEDETPTGDGGGEVATLLGELRDGQRIIVDKLDDMARGALAADARSRALAVLSRLAQHSDNGVVTLAQQAIDALNGA